MLACGDLHVCPGFAASVRRPGSKLNIWPWWDGLWGMNPISPAMRINILCGTPHKSAWKTGARSSAQIFFTGLLSATPTTTPQTTQVGCEGCAPTPAQRPLCFPQGDCDGLRRMNAASAPSAAPPAPGTNPIKKPQRPLPLSKPAGLVPGLPCSRWRVRVGVCAHGRARMHTCVPTHICVHFECGFTPSQGPAGRSEPASTYH